MTSPRLLPTLIPSALFGVALLGQGAARAESLPAATTPAEIAPAPGAAVPPSANTEREPVPVPAAAEPKAPPARSEGRAESQLAYSPNANPEFRDQPSAPIAARRPGDYEHDGFYVRFALGFGGMTDTLFMAENEDDPDAGVVNAFGTVGEASIGVAAAEGLILGGGLWATTAYATSFTQFEGEPVPERLRQPRSFVIAGGFGDWYFSKTTGFHAQAGLGLAVLTGVRWEQGEYENEAPALGPGLMLGIGHEWWVDKQWAIGALARLTASAAFEEVNDQIWTHAVGTFPSLLLTATYN